VIGTELEDAQGTFILTPAPVNGFDPRLDAVATSPAIPVVNIASMVPAEVAGTSVTVPVQSTESASLEVAVGEVAVGSSAASAGEDQVRVTPAAEESMPASSITAHTVAAIVSAAPSSVCLLTAAPLPAVVYQVANVVGATVPSVSGSSQRLADQFFQALARGVDGAAVTPLVLSPGDNLDSLNWDDMAAVETTLEPASPIRARRRSVITETPVAQPQANQAALDQVFVQTANDTDRIEMEE
jgi:hypothetical protein